MPTRFVSGDTPVVEFDPRLELSPFALFRRLQSAGERPLLVDVRPSGGALGLEGAVRMAGPEWSPPDDRDTVLFDDDGTAAVAEARRLQAAGHERVRALFGGLELYAFALDPEVVGSQTFLTESGRG